MKTKYCYIFDDYTKEYIGDALAYESPLEKDVFIAPPNSTYKQPPEYISNKTICLKDNEWQYFDDFRGDYSLNIDTNKIEIIKTIGKLENNYCLIPAKLLDDYLEKPLKYKFINNILTDITDSSEYKTLVNNVGKYLLNLNDGTTLYINEIMQVPIGCIVISPEIQKAYISEPDKYKIIENNLVDISNTKEYKLIQEEKIKKLHLTAADVERALYKAKKIDFDDILEIARNSNSIDLKELKIELKAKDFYRGNPYVDKIGKLLGFTSEQLNNFFKTNNYEYLITEKG